MLKKRSPKEPTQTSPYYDETGSPVLRPSFCVFADVLGFKSRVCGCSSPKQSQELCDTLHSCFSELHDVLQPIHIGVGESRPRWQYQLFSDSLVIGLPLDESRSDGEGELGGVISSVAMCQAILAADGFFVRGGLAFDELHMTPVLCFGKAAVEAYQLEHKAKWPRIVLSRHITRVVREYMNHYSDPGQSPWADDFLIDEEGITFINYLDVNNAAGWSNLDMLARHRDHILDNLAEQTDVSILEKYRWLADYHNFFCTNFICGTEDWWPSEDEVDRLRIDTGTATPHAFTRLAEPVQPSQPLTKFKVFRAPLVRRLLLAKGEKPDCA